MSITYNINLSLNIYQSNPNWYEEVKSSLTESESQTKRAGAEALTQFFVQPAVRFIQALRDTARLVIKVPIRAIATPIFFEKNWQERERAKVNAKLTGYAFVQLLSVPAKFIVALIAITTSAFSQEKAKWLLDESEGWTAYIDGRTSQLEALKEEGAKQAKNRLEFDQYRTWLYKIDPKICRQMS